MLLAVRLDCDTLEDQEQLFSFFKRNSLRWFWGWHVHEDGENPHYHWLLDISDTKWPKPDNNVRQEVRKHITVKGNKAYSVQICKDLDKYGSYVCFKHHTLSYEIEGFDDDTVTKWRDRGAEITVAVVSKEKKKNESDYIGMLIQNVGLYDWYLTHEQNCDRYLTGLRMIQKINPYVKFNALFLAWKNYKEFEAVVVPEEDEDGKVAYANAMSRYREYKLSVYGRLACLV